MNILVITRGSWNINNNTGNTLQKIFYNFKKCNIYNLYMQDEKPNNSCSRSNFKISEKELIENWFSGKETGEIYDNNDFYLKNVEEVPEKKLYKFAKIFKLNILWFIREIIWSRGHWKSKNLNKFLEDTNPDIIFMPLFGCWYPYKVLEYINRRTKAKIVLYHVDDVYSCKQYHISPLYWIYRFILRKWIKKIVKMSSINYCISDMQLHEYSKYFNKDFFLLHKDYKDDKLALNKKAIEFPIKMVFTGNIDYGRWKTLLKLGEAIDELNKNRMKAQLIIYSGSILTSKINRKIENISSIKYKGYISPNDIVRVQSEADILIHVESFKLRDLLEVRLSFSTKIIDYLNMKKPILAIGPNNVASIDYFIKNKIGFVICDENKIKSKLITLLNEENIMKCQDKIETFVMNKSQLEKKGSVLLYENFNRLMKEREYENNNCKCGLYE